jgi:hypothetical protein
VGALDSFVDGGERRVDLAEINGRVFVNNVSLGLYAEAVQRKGYRDAKLRTIVDTLPDALGPEGEGLDLRWRGPGGDELSSGAAILVSNNRYRLGGAVGSAPGRKSTTGSSGSRSPVLDDRTENRRRLQRPWRGGRRPRSRSAPRPIAAGIDGEALVLRAASVLWPEVLRVRIAQARRRLASTALPTALGTIEPAHDRRPAPAADIGRFWIRTSIRQRGNAPATVARSDRDTKPPPTWVRDERIDVALRQWRQPADHALDAKRAADDRGGLPRHTRARPHGPHAWPARTPCRAHGRLGRGNHDRQRR